MKPLGAFGLRCTSAGLTAFSEETVATGVEPIVGVVEVG